jgi:Raf kinase inhibitor-like YbhB/YbcL family protein
MILSVILLLITLIFLLNKRELFSNNKLEIISDSFIINKSIPQKHFCSEKGGSDLTPELSWNHAQNNLVKSYALTMEDTNSDHARDGNWTHWVVQSILATNDSTGNVTKSVSFPSMITENKDHLLVSDEQREVSQGINSWDKLGYKGPCPPKGKAHKYLITIYALDKVIICENCTKDKLIENMRGHIVYSGTYSGTAQVHQDI